MANLTADCGKSRRCPPCTVSAEEQARRIARNQLELEFGSPTAGRFIFAVLGPSSPRLDPRARYERQKNVKRVMALLRPHLMDVASLLAETYPRYAHHIRCAVATGRWRAPTVFSQFDPKAAPTQLVPDHVERRLANGESLYFVTALLEFRINVLIGNVRRTLLRGTL